ncbi:cytochrome C [Malaciobacter mytili]|uniref:Cytochrome C n=1 Tax=Malaciobacter mytili LMG 24559 TaxID=1032238 RepID=A0AAX2AET4_9BACT|nr:cytochrome C [Malaciobacter mytili]AXH16293.1 diheme cytochrome c [Malaciobacter mytili LMG 24559]RXI44693.1 cytochrome C [Malaciobacter mytili]RXK13806.1 cytochrome C [Malaciobacter mytili LMG 24559]
MNDLENHFGDDASIDLNTNNIILEFLEKNSAETSTKEASVMILDSLKNKDIIAITNTIYWKEKHKNIKKEIFLNSLVKSKANCKACHSDIEKGLIEDENIKDISSFSSM